MKKEVIILNIMYRGGYLAGESNIGHEIINLEQADDGKYYIWLNSMGTFNNKYKSKDYNRTVLMLRPVSSGVYKVLGKAEHCIPVEGSALSGGVNAKERFERQKRLNIRYDGVALSAVFQDNAFRGDDDSENTLVTFVADNVLIPAQELYLIRSEKETTGGADESMLSVPFRGKETLRMYFCEEDTDNKKDCYEKLHTLICDDSKWTKPETSGNEAIKDPGTNFFDIIGKSRDELAFSNALYYFLKKPGMASAFLHTLDDSIELDEEFEIYREKHNIDLLFLGKECVCILENKIASGINGKQSKNSSNLKEQIKSVCRQYIEQHVNDDANRKAVEEKVQQRIDKIESIMENTDLPDAEQVCSQLSKYYLYALNYAIDRVGDAFDGNAVKGRIKAFLLCPEFEKYRYKTNQAGQIVSDTKSKYAFSEYYTLKTYKDVYRFFMNAGIDDEYQSELLSGLKNLARECDDRLEREMRLRFHRMIERLKIKR